MIFLSCWKKANYSFEFLCLIQELLDGRNYSRITLVRILRKIVLRFPFHMIPRRAADADRAEA